MEPYLLSRTLDVLGKILIAYTAVSVHHRVMREHKIDAQVFKSMRKEQAFAILGIACILIAYAIDVVVHL